MKAKTGAAAIALCLLAAACGQFVGAHENLAVPHAAAAAPTAAAQAATAPGEVAAVAPAPGAPAVGRLGAPARAAGPARAPGPGVGRGDTTGVTKTTIRLGLHAPLTGAAPLKASSFAIGKDLYWDRGNDGKPVEIFGRRVEIVFQDDQYNPSHARLVCQQMAQSDRSFLLMGGGGTDQIQSCAQYAATRDIPYLSVGTTEVGLRRLGNYFPVTMSYAQQAPLLAQYVKNVLKITDPSRVAALVTNTANFDDFVSALTKSLPGIKVFRNDKNERGSQRASSLCTGTVKTYDVVITPNAPAYYLELASAAKCKPRYLGPGITNGLDQVADLGCRSDRSTLDAVFLSPAPAFEEASKGKFDPVFRKVAPAESDDIVWLQWGLMKTVHRLLLAAGPNPTREGFIAAAERASVRTGVFPDSRFTPDDHFAAQNASVLRNVCATRGNQSGYYVTEAAFRSSF